MSNGSGDDKQLRIVALGRLGWSLRRIDEGTGVRPETASGNLKAAGIGTRGVTSAKIAASCPPVVRSPGSTFRRARIGPLVGRGGMSEAYGSEQTALNCAVPIEVLPAEVSGDGSQLRDFVEDVRAASA